MNPDKLFDYLDGKLSPADREQLEEQLLSDAQLRHQLNIAREIHRSGRGSRELIAPSNNPAVAERGGRLGRRIATGAAVLVFLNVFVGLAIIVGKQKKTSLPNVGAQPAISEHVTPGNIATPASARGANEAPAAPGFAEAAKSISNKRAVTTDELEPGETYVYEGTALYVADQFIYGDRGGDKKAWAYISFDDPAGKLKSLPSRRLSVGQTLEAIVTFLEFKDGSTPTGAIGRLAVFKCHAFRSADGKYVELSSWSP